MPTKEEIIKLQKKLGQLMDKLKIHGGSWGEVSSRLKAKLAEENRNGKKKKGYSAAHIANLLNNLSSSNLDLQHEHLLVIKKEAEKYRDDLENIEVVNTDSTVIGKVEMVSDLKKPEYMETKSNVSLEHNSNIEIQENVRRYDAVHLFIIHELRRLATELEEDAIINIDVVGMRLRSVRKSFEEYLKKSFYSDIRSLFPRIRLNCLMVDFEKLSEDNLFSSGVGLRSLIEGITAEDIAFSIEGGMRKMLEIQGKLTSYTKGAPMLSMKVKLLLPAPNAYIIRINDVLLTNTYYAEKGNETHYEIVREVESKDKFDVIYGLFERYWKDDMSREVDDALRKRLLRIK